jgi:hypothetical protein
MTTPPKLQRIPMVWSHHETFTQWLQSLAPKPLPSEAPPADPKRPSRAGSEMGGGIQPPTPERWAR